MFPFLVELAKLFKRLVGRKVGGLQRLSEQGHRQHAFGQGRSHRGEGLVQVRRHVAEALARFRMGRRPRETRVWAIASCAWVTEAAATRNCCSNWS